MKYVIDVPDEFKDDVLMPSSTQGRTLGLPIKVMGLQYVVATGVKILPYTEPDKNVKNNYVHLCNSCVSNTSYCPALEEDVLSGDGEGFCNVCCCSCYIPKNYYGPESKDRKAIEDEVWQFAKDVRLETFIEDGNLYGYISKFDTYQEAKAKYEALKKQEEAICVGDEVKHKQYEWTGFVTNISESGYLTLMWGLGEASKGFDPEVFEKTGKHCAEVEELVKKICEEQHDDKEE